VSECALIKGWLAVAATSTSFECLRLQTHACLKYFHNLVKIDYLVVRTHDITWCAEWSFLWRRSTRRRSASLVCRRLWYRLLQPLLEVAHFDSQACNGTVHTARILRPSTQLRLMFPF
jgi:hypothetical protein